MVSVLYAMAALGQAPQKIDYKPYVNARFGFSCEFPTFLKANPDPANGDGRSWQSKDGSILLIASGMLNAMEDTLGDFYRRRVAEARTHGDSDLYFKLDKQWCVVSFKDGKTIHYSKTWLVGDVFSSVTFQYHERHKKAMDPVVQRLVKSFRPARP